MKTARGETEEIVSEALATIERLMDERKIISWGWNIEDKRRELRVRDVNENESTFLEIEEVVEYEYTDRRGPVRPWSTGMPGEWSRVCAVHSIVTKMPPLDFIVQPRRRDRFDPVDYDVMGNRPRWKTK